jgi:hypothetical protein
VARNWTLTERCYSRDGTSGTFTAAKRREYGSYWWFWPTVEIARLPKRSFSGGSEDDRKGAEPPIVDRGTAKLHPQTKKGTASLSRPVPEKEMGKKKIQRKEAR